MKKIIILIFILVSILSINSEWLVYKNTDGIDLEYLKIYKDIKISDEKYFYYSPKNVSKNKKLSLWVFIHAGDNFEIPPDWKKFCDKNKIAILAAQKVGNKASTLRRIGVTLFGTIKTISTKNIDPEKVYIFGYSGGARVAAITIFYYNQIYKGCLGICGIEYNKKIDFVSCQKKDDYGYFEFNGGNIENIKKNNLFAIITGSKDFRYCYLKDIYEYGFKKDGYNAKLFDYEGYDHIICNSDQLEDVLKFFNE